MRNPALAITEKEFLGQIKDLANLMGWAFYHPFLSKWSERGWPDVVLVRPPRMILAELKTDTSKLTKYQARWLWMLRKIKGIEVYIWRPRHLEHIAQILAGEVKKHG